ncbi:DUF6622 family protein [Hydrogenophaga sp.]|uniref:DUF6622 family protein n=1 Tax=Hydrogenophaga sp. TaxID=1904254 RepID=UPI003F703626
MLLQLITQHPEAIVQILRSTPVWVWGLLAGLLALGVSQLRDRTASLARVSLLPLAMTLFSVSGTASALGGSPHRAMALAAWLIAAALAFAVALLARGRGDAAAAQYDPARRLFLLPGSVVPLLLIVGIFLVKYVVGVDLAMAPQLVQEAPYVLTVAALYGAFTGIFVGRASRLWRLWWLRRAHLDDKAAQPAVRRVGLQPGVPQQ